MGDSESLLNAKAANLDENENVPYSIDEMKLEDGISHDALTQAPEYSETSDEDTESSLPLDAKTKSPGSPGTGTVNMNPTDSSSSVLMTNELIKPRQEHEINNAHNKGYGGKSPK